MLQHCFGCIMKSNDPLSRGRTATIWPAVFAMRSLASGSMMARTFAASRGLFADSKKSGFVDKDTLSGRDQDLAVQRSMKNQQPFLGFKKKTSVFYICLNKLLSWQDRRVFQIETLFGIKRKIQQLQSHWNCFEYSSWSQQKNTYFEIHGMHFCADNQTHWVGGGSFPTFKPTGKST